VRSIEGDPHGLVCESLEEEEEEEEEEEGDEE
jgi:hypothetical protein